MGKILRLQSSRLDYIRNQIVFLDKCVTSACSLCASFSHCIQTVLAVISHKAFSLKTCIIVR